MEAIEEQITRLDAAVEGLKRVQRQLRRYRAAVLKAACEGRLVPTEAELARAEGRKYEPADKLLERIKAERQIGKQADFAELNAPKARSCQPSPDGWAWTNLAQLKRFSMYGPRFSSDAYRNKGRAVLRTSDMSESGKVNMDSAPRLPLSDEEFRKYQVEVGDLLITRTGSLGTLAVYNDRFDAIAGAYLIQYRLFHSGITSWYLFYFLKSPVGQHQLVRGGAGVGRPNLNAPTIEAIPIPFPPLAEQHRIVAEIERRLSVVEKAEAVVEANLKRAARMRQSILKRAFEGKLVPQDPNDEPASVLLERIRVERERAAGAGAGPKGRGRRPSTQSSGGSEKQNGQLRLLDADDAMAAKQRVMRRER